MCKHHLAALAPNMLCMLLVVIIVPNWREHTVLCMPAMCGMHVSLYCLQSVTGSSNKTLN